MKETSSRLKLVDFLVTLFKKTPSNIIDKVIYLIQGRIRPEYEGTEMGLAEKMVIRAISMASGITIEEVQGIYHKRGDLGEAAEQVMKIKKQTTLFSEKMTMEKIYTTFDKITTISGSGSLEAKLRMISSLFNDSSPLESKYIVKFILGNLRLGIADNSIMDALSVAFTSEKSNRKILESAYNVSSDLGKLGKLLALDGIDLLKSMKITLFTPIRPMLAERVQTFQEGLEKMGGKTSAEFKLDGERVQIHKGKKKTVIFSRSLENITSYYPDVIDAVNTLKAKEIILEAEVVAINENTGEFLPFQELMHRRRKYNIRQTLEKYPILINLFDVLYINGSDKSSLLYTQRRKILETLITKSTENKIRIIPQQMTTNIAKLEEFMSKAIEHGCEGLMLKELTSTYRAGAREYAWIKIKREYRSELADTLDLVVVGALYGRGRRTGRYGALLLAVRDSYTDGFKSVCKVGSGFKDRDLDSLWKNLENYVIQECDPRVKSSLKVDTWIKPVIVIEVIASEITLSPAYDAGMNSIRKGFGLSLRFPKYTGKIRLDKNAENATEELELINMYKQQRSIKP